MGEKVDVEGLGVCRSQHQCSGGRGTDHTGEAQRYMASQDIFNPTSL